MLLARKKSMTQIYDEKGLVSPVTILDFSECIVKKGNKHSGTFICYGNKNKPRKSETGIFGEEQVPQFSIKIDNEITEPDSLNPGDIVNITATSKGRGFQGVVKSYGFKGGKRTHGQSDRERAPGSIGAGTTMGRVLKGMRMATRLGGEKVTIRRVKILSVDAENKLLTLKGSVPGGYNSIVQINKI